jgi:NAD(P)-dependent dehydrogenase (short-subunit alcohol dehydrogenase family)
VSSCSSSILSKHAFAVAEVTRLTGLPDVVVNCHGVVRPSYFQELDLAVFSRNDGIDYFGALHY